jgi:hypothetical protein
VPGLCSSAKGFRCITPNAFWHHETPEHTALHLILWPTCGPNVAQGRTNNPPPTLAGPVLRGRRDQSLRGVAPTDLHSRSHLVGRLVCEPTLKPLVQTCAHSVGGCTPVSCRRCEFRGDHGCPVLV